MFPLEQGGQKILKKRKKEKQKEKKNPLRSCAINSLEIHRFNEIKGLNAWMVSLASHLKSARENAFKIFEVNNHAKTQIANT